MKHLFRVSCMYCAGMLTISLLFFTTSVAFGQNPCPPQTGVRTSNPDFPGCLPPGSGAFRVLLVLDESGSVGPFETQFENAVRGFATTLASGATATGEMQMGIVEFAGSAAVGLALTDVKSPGFINAVNNYLGAGYSPSGQTNYLAGLTTAKGIAGVDIIFFISDGNPTTSTMSAWQAIANQIKCAGTYIFGIGLGGNISMLNIQALSGPDQLGNPKSLSQGADWVQATFTSLPAALVDLAQSQIDRQKPVLQCPNAMVLNNNPGECGKNVTFTPVVSDNCPNVQASCAPASGSFFPVGQTPVTCTARDNVGNVSNCTFSITVLDMESPMIECPLNTTVSCETSLAPASIGEAIALDNCAVTQMTHADVRTDGRCTYEYLVTRTWSVSDAAGNTASCLYQIQVIDNTQPAITCPPAITVECDTTVAKTGMATATDNCDTRLDITHADRLVSGDCEWLCTVERTWEATDDCRNTKACVQLITKNTAALLETVLPVTVGQSSSTVTVPTGRADCIVKWLPYNGTQPKGLVYKNFTAAADCLPGTNPIDASGHITNPLFGEVLKMTLLAKLKPAFGTTKLNTLGCPLVPIMQQYLAPNPDVNELIRVANTALGNIAVQPHLKELQELLECINSSRTVCD